MEAHPVSQAVLLANMKFQDNLLHQQRIMLLAYSPPSLSIPSLKSKTDDKTLPSNQSLGIFDEVSSCRKYISENINMFLMFSVFIVTTVLTNVNSFDIITISVIRFLLFH